MSHRWIDCRRCIAACVVALSFVALFFTACATADPGPAWEGRLAGDAVVLLGEVHDNADSHRARLDVLRRAIADGWRPAIAMEQFDREHQADIERARRESPRDAQHLIDTASPAHTDRGMGSGWDWEFYRPVIELALAYDLPLIAANLSNADTTRIVRGGFDSVFDAAQMRTLQLDRPIDAEWQAAQEREIDSGHCHMLPRTMWPRMARAQFARDAVMAETIRTHGQRGIVLLAGTGHVRRDIGVPRWLDSASLRRTFSVGYVEHGDDAALASLFDAVVVVPPAERPDPCEGFRQRRLPSPDAGAASAPARAAPATPQG